MDFALCCHAVREGLDQEAVWREVQEVGKFAEGGLRYFDLTWENAEERVRSQIYQRTCRRAGSVGTKSFEAHGQLYSAENKKK